MSVQRIGQVADDLLRILDDLVSDGATPDRAPTCDDPHRLPIGLARTLRADLANARNALARTVALTADILSGRELLPDAVGPRARPSRRERRQRQVAGR